MVEQPFIRIQDLTKYYKGSSDPAIKSITLDIFKGEIFGLLGPNGAGKTTTISILCGLFPPTEGMITINGLDIKSDLQGIKRIIGVVPQEVALYPTLTAMENLTFFGNMYNLRGKVLREKILERLIVFGLERFAKTVGPVSLIARQDIQTTALRPLVRERDEGAMPL